jgi:toxin-antitoxin system PIN domain toxin
LIAVDTNILVYAHREELPLHSKALARLTDLAESPLPWGLPVFCIAEFLRVVTHPKLFDPPSSIEDGLEAIAGLAKSPSLALLNPGAMYWDIFYEVARQSRVHGNLLYDAQIVAVCRENGVNDILSEDRDFSRFMGVNLHTL